MISLRQQRTLRIDGNQRKFCAKSGALARPAFDGDCTPMLRHDPLRNSQAKSNSSLAAAASFVDAVEPFKDFLLVLAGDARSGTLHRHDSRFFPNFERKAHRTRRRRVLEGV